MTEDEVMVSRRHVGVAVLSVLVLNAPYAVAGPGFFLDDWFALRAARLDGWHMAAGSEQWAARPGAGVVYALTFGLLQDRPLAYFAISTVLLMAAAVLLLSVSTRLTSSTVLGRMITGVWLVSPNHSSLEMWPSALNILAALVLLLGGCELLTRSMSNQRSDALAAALLAMGTLTYEAVAPAAVVLVVLVAVRRRPRGRGRVQLLVVGLGAQGLCLLWMLLHWHPAKSSINRWIALDRVVAGQIADGIFGDWLVGRVFGVVVLAFTALIAGRRLLTGRWADARSSGLFIAGSAIVLLGAVPFVRYFYAPVGFGDRVTVVSGVGGACLLVAVALEMRVLTPRSALPAVALAVAFALAWRVEMVSTYATAADDGRRILDAVERRFPAAPDEPLVFGPNTVIEHNVAAFLQVDWAVQWLYGTNDVVVVTTSEAEVYEATEPRFRFDLVRLSRIGDDGDQ